MISAEELERLMEASIGNPEAEPAFIRALLDALVYAHAPIEPNADRLRFIMFKSPYDGTLVIPAFTTLARATDAARGKATIIKMGGRMLFEMTRGATIMINPNDVRCTLYPEEISRLLDDGTVAPVQRSQVAEGDAARPYKLPSVPKALGRELKRVLRHIAGIEVAYIAATRSQEPGYPDGLLIALVGNGKEQDRTARAIATALYDEMCKLDKPVDIVQYIAGEPLPSWVKNLGVKPFYRRRASDARKVPSKLN